MKEGPISRYGRRQQAQARSWLPCVANTFHLLERCLSLCGAVYRRKVPRLSPTFWHCLQGLLRLHLGCLVRQ